MKLAIIIILSILAFILIASIVIAYFLCRYYAHPNLRTYEGEIKRYKEIGVLYDYEKYKFEEFEITLKENIVLNARYFEFNKGSNKFVILCHGFGVSQISMSKYFEAYINNGFNIITYDERGQGKNKYTTCGMSYFESSDLIQVIDCVKNRFGKDIKLGIHGESMGAATVVGSLKYKPDINFAVADCPFCDLKVLSIKVAKERYHVPMYIIDMCGPIGKMFFKYNPNKVKPIDGMNNSKVPLLVCHGVDDKLVPYYHSKIIYDEYCGPKELFLVEGADHAQATVVGRKEYQKKIKELTDKYC